MPHPHLTPLLLSKISTTNSTPQIRKGMGKKKIAARSRVRPFIKIVNYNHVMPTRYNMDLDKEIKGKISTNEQSKKDASKKVMRELFEARYKAGKNKWFFQKLRF